MKKIKDESVSKAQADALVAKLRTKGHKAKDVAAVGKARSRRDLVIAVAELHGVSMEQLARFGIEL